MNSTFFLEKKSEKILNKVLKDKVKYFLHFYIKDNILNIKLNSRELENYNAAYKLKLPSFIDIYNAARCMYKKFEMDNITNICYVFEKVDFSGPVDISPDFSDVQFLNCILEDLNIYGGDTITLNNCEAYYYQNVRINSKKVNLLNCKFKKCDEVTIKSDELYALTSTLTAINDITINSQFITFKYFGLAGENVNLKCDLIDTEYSILRATDVFKIDCKYNEKISNIKSEKYIYNNVDITNSESIQRSKLLRKLIIDLKELKNIINETITNDVEETTRIKRQTLEEKPIIKVLNKKNS